MLSASPAENLYKFSKNLYKFFRNVGTFSREVLDKFFFSFEIPIRLTVITSLHRVRLG